MKEPSWLKEVQPYSTLDYKDLIQIFGFKSKTHFEEALNKKLLPPFDKRCTRGGKGAKRLWFVKTIRKEIRRINAEETNGKEVLSVMPTDETSRKDEVNSNEA